MILINKRIYSETKVRKHCSCSRCESEIKKGEGAYRPKHKPTSAKNRVDRICRACGESFISRETPPPLDGVAYVPRYCGGKINNNGGK